MNGHADVLVRLGRSRSVEVSLGHKAGKMPARPVHGQGGGGAVKGLAEAGGASAGGRSPTGLTAT